MSLPERRAWRWAIRLAVVASIVLLWTATAGADAEWMLWRHYGPTQAALNVAGSSVLVALGYLLSARATLAARLARTTALAAATAGTLCVLELPAVFGHDYGRTFGTGRNDTFLQLAMGINRWDDELIHLHLPHSRFRGTVTGNLVFRGLPNPVRYDVDVAYDHNGFRNDIDFTEAELVAIGDSFVEGAETPSAQTVVAELGRRLGVSAVNLGQSAYGPQQELIVLRRYGAPLAPKTVVWFVFSGNDLSDVDSYEWRRAHVDQFLAPPPFRARTFTRNAVTALARLTTLPRRKVSPWAREFEFTYVRPDGSSEIHYLDGNEELWKAHQWDVMSATLLAARDLTASLRADFLVVFVPRKLRVYRGFLRAAPDALAHKWQLNNLPDVLSDFCRTHAIAFLDSTGALREAVARGESVYLTDDLHWNAAGHRVAAAAVAERLQQMKRPAPGGGAQQ